MNTAEILFTGIISFVSAMNGNPMAAVAVNASTPTLTASGATIPAHKAWIRFDLGDLADDSAVRPDRVVERDGVTYGVVFVHGESVRIANRMLDADLALEDGIPGDPEAPTAANEHFLYWVPRMRDMLGTMPRLDPAYLDRDPSPELIAMRFELTRGHLATTRLAPAIAEFQPRLGSGLRRAVAQEVGLDVRLDAPLVLELAKFRSSETRTLRFRSPATKVLIANAPEEELAPAEAAHVHDASVARHYELYYRFLLDPPDSKPISVAVRSSSPDGRWHMVAHGDSTGYCGPDSKP
ncbi:MAG TPA: hypothetical protein VN605_01745 [Thermoanaerobaculia bacterium]|nr:hypothetical protein [Thermoanaerobaculia bacterium]